MTNINKQTHHVLGNNLCNEMSNFRFNCAIFFNQKGPSPVPKQVHDNFCHSSVLLSQGI